MTQTFFAPVDIERRYYLYFALYSWQLFCAN